MRKVDSATILLSEGYHPDLRIIDFSSDVTAESCQKLLMQILTLTHLNNEKPITIYINSSGGDATEALILYDFLTALDVELRTVASGPIESAATILFLAGDVRKVTKHAEFNFHTPKLTLKGDNSAEDLRRFESTAENILTRYCDVYAEKSNQTSKWWYNKLKNGHDLYLYKQDLIEMGIVHEN